MQAQSGGSLLQRLVWGSGFIVLLKTIRPVLCNTVSESTALCTYHPGGRIIAEALPPHLSTLCEDIAEYIGHLKFAIMLYYI